VSVIAFLRQRPAVKSAENQRQRVNTNLKAHFHTLDKNEKKYSKRDNIAYYHEFRYQIMEESYTYQLKKRFVITVA